jgi:hypothetical protein
LILKILPKLNDIIETYRSEGGGHVDIVKLTHDAYDNFICFWESKGCKAWRHIELPNGEKYVIFDPIGNMASKDMPY